jgi:hypothetical protein
MDQFAINQVRAHSFDLLDDVTLPSQRHGHYQNDAGAADNDAEHRKDRPHFIGA